MTTVSDWCVRLVIPVESKLWKQVKEDDMLVVEEVERGVRLKSLNNAVQEAQEYFLYVIPKEVSLVDELCDYEVLLCG